MYARRRHGVIEARPHAAYRAVPFKIGEPRRARRCQKSPIKKRLGQCEGHIHPGAAIVSHRICVEARAIDLRVKSLGFQAIALAHGNKAALPEEPLENKPTDIPGKGWRRIHHRALRGKRLIVPDRGRAGARPLEKIIAYDDYSEARGAKILLRTCIDESAARYIKGPR